MENFKNKCDIAYELGKPVITDSVYDSLFGCNSSSIDSMSMREQEREQESLPFWVGSLTKIKTEKALSLWLRKNLSDTFVVSCKLDGISAIYHNNKLYTRGNGLKGTDISIFLNNINMSLLEIVKKFSLRGELVMKKNVFKKKYSKNSSDHKFKNSRNLVAGQFAKKEINKKIIQDIDFIPYEIINQNNQENKQLLPYDQLNMLSDPNSKFIFQIIDRKNLTIDNLTNIFNKFSILSDYAIDGLVVTANVSYTRNTHGNPKYSFAFKKENENTSAISVVTKVQWTLSKYGVYIPVVHINPVELSGCIISKLTGHNAKYIIKNKIEEGAEIICVRSGDVIPHIIDIIKPSEKTISLPNGYWDGVHIKKSIDTSSETSSEIEIKILTYLLSKLEIKNINIKTVEKIYNYFQIKQGTDVFLKLIDCSDDILLPVFKNKTHSKIISEFANLKSKPIQLSTLISGSSLLGFGISDKRIEILLSKFPTFLNVRPSMKELCGINGFSSKLSQKIIDNYSLMVEFIQKCRNKLNIIGIDDDAIQIDVDKIKICLSGFRDKTLNNKYIILNSVTKDCKFLVIDDFKSMKNTIKVKQAQKLNIPIISRLHFFKNLEK